MVVRDIIERVIRSFDDVLPIKIENKKGGETSILGSTIKEAPVKVSKFTRPLREEIPSIETAVGYRVSLHLPGDTDEESDLVIEGIVESIDIKRKLLFVDTVDGLVDLPYNSPGLTFAYSPELVTNADILHAEKQILEENRHMENELN